MGDVVVNADAEMVLGRLRRSVVEHALDHRGSKFLGAESVSAAEDNGVEAAGEESARAGFRNGCADFLIEGFAHGAEFLCSVENGDDFRSLRNGCGEFLYAERAEHSHFENAEFFAFGIESLYGFLNCLGAAAHYDDDFFGIGRAFVLVGLVSSASELAELFHLFLDYVGALVVERIASLPGLEEDVGILGRAADKRPVGIERAGADIEHFVVINHFAHDFVGNHIVGIYLVRGSKSIEEVQERHAAVERSGVGNEREVVRFLDAIGAEHCEPCLAACHNVGLVAEYREAVACYGARGHVHYKACQFARYLIHIGNHQ